MDDNYLNWKVAVTMPGKETIEYTIKTTHHSLNGESIVFYGYDKNAVLIVPSRYTIAEKL